MLLKYCCIASYKTKLDSLPYQLFNLYKIIYITCVRSPLQCNLICNCVLCTQEHLTKLSEMIELTGQLCTYVSITVCFDNFVLSARSAFQIRYIPARFSIIMYCTIQYNNSTYMWQVIGICRRGAVGRVPTFQPGGPGSIPGGVRNFNSYPGIGCVSFEFCPVLSPAKALTFCWPHIQEGPPLCICLVFRSIDNCSPYRHLTHGHLGCKSRGV